MQKMYLQDPETEALLGPFTMDQFRELAEVGALTNVSKVTLSPLDPPLELSEYPGLCERLLIVPRELHLKASQTSPSEEVEAVDIAPVSVDTILQENLAREQELRGDAMEPIIQRRRGRRTRDYIVLMLVGWTLVGTAIFVLGANPMTLVFGISLITLYTIGTAWLLFGVINRY